METMYIVKEFFEKTIKSKCLEIRDNNTYVNLESRSNYLFNSQINGLEESDFILLAGTNPRLEATILNARIRKSYLANNTSIYSIGDIGDQTYPYEKLPAKTKTIKDICENKSEISKKIISAKKPIIIIGNSILNLKSGKFIFENLKKFLIDNKKITDSWNPLNILQINASSVGGYDLKLINGEENITLKQLQENFFDIIFLFGQDNLKFKKKNEYVVYIGSHGDNGAEISDLILPGAAYTEQDGHYTNLEGKIQKAYRASFPPGEAKEDFQIINELCEHLKRKKLFKDKSDLVDNLFNYLDLNQKKSNFNKTLSDDFLDEEIQINQIDYYYSNVISRASRTMSECRNTKINIKRTGTEG